MHSPGITTSSHAQPRDDGRQSRKKPTRDKKGPPPDKKGPTRIKKRPTPDKKGPAREKKRGRPGTDQPRKIGSRRNKSPGSQSGDQPKRPETYRSASAFCGLLNIVVVSVKYSRWPGWPTALRLKKAV